MRGRPTLPVHSRDSHQSGRLSETRSSMAQWWSLRCIPTTRWSAPSGSTHHQDPQAVVCGEGTSAQNFGIFERLGGMEMLHKLPELME